MAQEDGQYGGQYPQQEIRHRGRISNRPRRRKLGGDSRVLEEGSRPKQDGHDLSKRQLLDLFKGKKGKTIQSLVNPILTPLIPPGLLPPTTTSSEVITPFPTPEPVLSTPPDTTTVIEPPPTTTEEAPSPVTPTPPPSEVPAEPIPETTTTTAPIIVPAFPPPIGVITTEIPGSGVTTIPLPAPPPPPILSTETTEIFTSPVSPTSSELPRTPSISSLTTFLTLTSSTAAATTSLGIPDTTEDATPVSTDESTPNSAGRIAGIVIGTLLGVLLLIALIFFWWRRRRQNAVGRVARASTPAGESLLKPIKDLDLTIGGFFGRIKRPSRKVDFAEVKRPEPTRQRSTRRFEETIPNITLTAVAEEDERGGLSPAIGRRNSASTRIVISRTPRLFTRQQSPRSSFLAEPGGRDQNSQASEAAGSRSNTPFRNSTISEASSTWMTTVTQKTDGEYVPTTALRYPGVPVPPPPARQGPGPGVPVEEQGQEQEPRPIPVPGPSKWLSPPSWRVMARRSLSRSLRSDGGRSRSSRGSPSDSEKSQST